MGYTVLLGPKSVDSSWLDTVSFIYFKDKQGVAVEFIDGTEVFYPDTTMDDYYYLIYAVSKGKALWAKFYYLPYELI